MTSCALDMVTQRDPLFVPDPVGSLSCKEWDVSGSRICVVSRARSRSWLHICVRSRASGQNSSYRSVRSNWLMNSTSLVDVSDETVTACRSSGVYSRLLGQDTACQWTSRRAAGCSCLRDLISRELPCRARALDAQLLDLNCAGSRIGSAFCGVVVSVSGR